MNSFQWLVIHLYDLTSKLATEFVTSGLFVFFENRENIHHDLQGIMVTIHKVSCSVDKQDSH